MKELRMQNGEVVDADTVPWCPECELYAVPKKGDRECPTCGTELEYREEDS
jgi:uncharacterized Zn finger protein (UPF0148 family)